jgi:predicted CoA-binding protein
MNAADTVDRLVRGMRTVAVVGLSDKPSRPSHGVASYLQRHGIRIIPVNPRLADREVLGERAYASLTDIPRGIHVDIVDIFRRSELVAPVVDEAIARGEGAIWMQLGIVDEVSADRARRAGHDVVMDLCLAVEHRRLRSA